MTGPLTKRTALHFFLTRSGCIADLFGGLSPLMRKWGYRHFGCFSTRLVPRFLALRYGGILASMPIVFLSAVRSHNCQLAASLSQAGVVVVIVASATIFTFRTAILWADNRIIRWSLGGLLIIMAGCWVRAFFLLSQLSVKPGNRLLLLLSTGRSLAPPHRSGQTVMSFPP